MKRAAENPSPNYDGQKIQKTNESSSANNNSSFKCFPIELGILNEICSFSNMSTQCSLYAVCKSIRDIMDGGDNFLYHHQSRKILMLMKEACGEFNSEEDKRNFFLGMHFRLNAEIALLDVEIMKNITVDRNTSSLFCINNVKTGNSSFCSAIRKYQVRNSNQYLLVNSDYATFQAHHSLYKFIVSCNGRVLISYTKHDQNDRKVFIDVDKCGLDNVLKYTTFGIRQNIQAFIKQQIPNEIADVDAIHKKLIDAYAESKNEPIQEVDKFGWCTNFPSKKGIQHASNLIDKICKIPKKSILLILKYIRSASYRFSSIRISQVLQSPTFKNFINSSSVSVIRIFYDENCYEKVKFDVKIRGSLKENHQFFTLKYACENYSGDDDFVDVSLECYFNNPKDSFYIYDKCTESSRFDEPNSSTSDEYLLKIGKILGTDDDPTNIVKLMSAYAMSHKCKLFNIQDYFMTETESGANKKPFKFMNGAEKAEEFDTEDDIFNYY